MRREVVGHVDGGGVRALVQHGGLFFQKRGGWLRNYQLRHRTGTLDAPIFPLLSADFSTIAVHVRVHRSPALIQNTSPSEFSVAAQPSRNSVNTASHAAGPPPISHKHPPR